MQPASTVCSLSIVGSLHAGGIYIRSEIGSIRNNDNIHGVYAGITNVEARKDASCIPGVNAVKYYRECDRLKSLAIA